MKRSSIPVLIAAVLLLAGGVTQAADPGAPPPEAFSFWLEPLELEVNQGETGQLTAYLAHTQGELQGWSWGICDDDPNPGTVTAIEATVEGTDAAVVRNGEPPEFEATNTLPGGVTQGAVIHILQQITLAPIDRFSMAVITYRFDGAPGEETTADYCSLGNPRIDPVVVVVGLSVEPATLDGATLRVRKDNGDPEPTFATEPGSVNLMADETTEANVRVMLGLKDTSPAAGFQGWSYGLKHDAAKVTLVTIEPSSLTSTSNDGDAPDFWSAEINPVGGSGGTVGCVVSLTEPFSELPAGAGESKHTETFTYTSAITIEPGQPSQTTDLAMADEELAVGDGPKVPAVASINSDSWALTEVAATTITLSGEKPPPLRAFIRGDANNDKRVDISDGIWILSYKFRGGIEPPCLDAADANDDGTVDQTDAMRVVYYYLAVQNTPAPMAPFPSCGTDPSDTNSDAPEDGLSCKAWGLSCQP